MIKVADPVRFYKYLWPDGELYQKQREILYSLRDNDETVVPAGHKLGKDYICGFAVLWFFLSREPCRIVTTSVDSYQLGKVLWGEIHNFINTARYKLPLIVNNLELRKPGSDKSYVIARVAQKGEGMTGHHLPRKNGVPSVLGVFDESSGIDHETYSRLDTCTHRNLIVGNPYECENFFRWSVEGNPGSEDVGGDVKRLNGEGYRRKIIHIGAEDSPNVQLAIKEMRLGYRRPEPLLVKTDKRPWGVFTQEEFEELQMRWEN